LLSAFVSRTVIRCSPPLIFTTFSPLLPPHLPLVMQFFAPFSAWGGLKPGNYTAPTRQAVRQTGKHHSCDHACHCGP
jgi:hypothetical protein